MDQCSIKQSCVSATLCAAVHTSIVTTCVYVHTSLDGRMLCMYIAVALFVSICTGYMLGNLPVEKSGIISKEHVCEGTHMTSHVVSLWGWPSSS